MKRYRHFLTAAVFGVALVAFAALVGVTAASPPSGVTPNLADWARAVNRMGFAAFVVDSFGPRGVTEVCTGRTPVSIGSRLADAYRALALLAAHPRIDPRRIAALGFSHGGWVALWASQAQFERRFLRADAEFAAYAAFYPAGCNAQLLAETDILYTKPSELSFFAALGIPLVCARPVGHHERLNRRFLLEAGAGFKQWDPRHTAQWIDEWLLDGTLAAGAWSGFMRLPKTGTYRILELLGHGDGRARSPGA